MKATVTASGTLEITSETPLEAYALRKWSEDSTAEMPNMTKTIKYSSILIRCEEGG